MGGYDIGYPWIFREIKHFFKTGEILPPPDLIDRVDAAANHLKNSILWKGRGLACWKCEDTTQTILVFRELKNIEQNWSQNWNHRYCFEILEKIQSDFREYKVLNLRNG